MGYYHDRLVESTLSLPLRDPLCWIYVPKILIGINQLPSSGGGAYSNGPFLSNYMTLRNTNEGCLEGL